MLEIGVRHEGSADSQIKTLPTAEPPRPRISVIIPVYNGAEYIAGAIQSCLRQTEAAEEIIVIDDGSDDATPAILRSFADCPAVRLYRQPNSGVSAARNLGIQMSSESFVAFLDADDVLLPHALETRRNAIAAHPGADVFFSDFEMSDAPGVRRSAHDSLDIAHRLSEWLEPGDGDAVRLDRGFAKAYAAYTVPHSLVHTSAITIRRRLFDEIGGFDEGRAVGEDYELWIRAFLAGESVLLRGRPQSSYFRWRGTSDKYVDDVGRRLRRLGRACAEMRRFSPEWRALRRRMAREWLSLIYLSGIGKTDRLTLIGALLRSIACYPQPWMQAKYACLLLLPGGALRQVYALRASSAAWRTNRAAQR